MATPTNRVVERLRKEYGRTVLHHWDWGAQHRLTYGLRRNIKPAKVPCDTVWQHITVTLDTGPLTGDFKTDVRTVERIGWERFRSGVSYNWIVDMRTGEIAVGMPLDAKGTHTVMDKDVPNYSYDQNYWARAIAVLGMPSTPLSEEAERSIVCIMAAMVDEGVVRPGFDYNPHSMAAYKDCPSDPTRNRMEEMRDKVWPARRKAEKGGKPKQKDPTRVTKARDLLGKVLHRADKRRRRRRIKKGLETLPKR